MTVLPGGGPTLLLVLLFSGVPSQVLSETPDHVQSSSELLNHVELTPSTTSIHVSWDVKDPKDGVAREYRVSWKCQNVVRGNLYIDDATEATISGLKPCNEYIVYVTLIDEAGEPTGDTVLRKTKTLNEAPPTVTGLQSQISTPKSIILTWERPDTACEVTSYRISFSGTALWGSLNPHSDVTTIGGNAANRATLHELEGLQPYSEYSVTVVAYTEGGAGEPAPVTFTTAQSEPSKPVNLKSTKPTATSITATWDEPTEKNGVLSHYYISWYMDGHRIGSQQESHTRHTISGLSPCVEYQIRVAASTAAGKGDYREITQRTDAGAPSQPVGTICHRNPDQTVSVTWAKPETACPITGFKVLRPGNSLEPNAMSEIVVPSSVFSANFSTVPGLKFRVCVAAVASDTIVGPQACCEPPSPPPSVPTEAPQVAPTPKRAPGEIDRKMAEGEKGSTVPVGAAVGIGVGAVVITLIVAAVVGFVYWRKNGGRSMASAHCESGDLAVAMYTGKTAHLKGEEASTTNPLIYPK